MFVVLCLSAVVVNKKAVVILNFHGVGERAQRQGGGAANDDAIKHNMRSTHRRPGGTGECVCVCIFLRQKITHHC